MIPISNLPWSPALTLKQWRWTVLMIYKSFCSIAMSITYYDYHCHPGRNFLLRYNIESNKINTFRQWWSSLLLWYGIKLNKTNNIIMPIYVFQTHWPMLENHRTLHIDAQNGSKTIRPRQICLWSFGLLICGWGLELLDFWAWEEFWGRIVTDSRKT